ncbi:MAG: DUF72 domain-containing protein [Polyangiaceae bacterium]
MDFGRVESVEGVSFELPPIGERSRRVLAESAARRGAELLAEDASPGAAEQALWLRTGAPAWGRKDWIGRFYPPGTPDKEFLRLYSRKVSAIELNASYYRVPSAETLDGWAAETPAEFRFCPKMHQSVTHRRALAESIPEAQGFAERMLRLGERLGPAFIQLPPWAGPEVLPALDVLLASLPRALRMAVELRHPGWFEGGGLHPGAVEVLEKNTCCAVITDVAGRRDVCHSAVTAPFVIVRFVGNGLHPTDLPRLDAWLDRLIQLRGLGLHEAYFFAHQPDDALAPETLHHFTAGARERGIDMPAATLETPASHARRGEGEGAGQLDLFGERNARATRGRRR